MHHNIISIIGACIFLLGCNVAQDKNAETITSGTLKLGVDESYSLLMDTEVFTYTHLNKYARIESTIAPEAEIVKALLADSIQAAVIGRALTEEELAYFKSIQRLPESFLIARDGVALIVHPGARVVFRHRQFVEPTATRREQQPRTGRFRSSRFVQLTVAA